MNLNVKFSEAIGKMKPMHAVNNAPVRPMRTQCRGNFDTFKALKIPYARTHDASLSEIYGSQHVMDVHCIFADFSRDPDDPTAYDFRNLFRIVLTAGNVVKEEEGLCTNTDNVVYTHSNCIDTDCVVLIHKDCKLYLCTAAVST